MVQGRDQRAELLWPVDHLGYTMAHAWHTEQTLESDLAQPCTLASIPLISRNDGVRGSSPRVGLFGARKSL